VAEVRHVSKNSDQTRHRKDAIGSRQEKTLGTWERLESHQEQDEAQTGLPGEPTSKKWFGGRNVLVPEKNRKLTRVLTEVARHKNRPREKGLLPCPRTREKEAKALGKPFRGVSESREKKSSKK